MKNNKVLDITKRVFWAVFFLFLICICTSYIMQTTKDKGNYLKYQQFYEEKENFDVLFFGSSRVLDAVYPMELWQDHGITSYNMAQHAENLNITYWQMKNAFKHNTPKVAVVDLSLLGAGKVVDSDMESKSYLHKSLDHMPFSKLKYDALKNLTQDVDIWEYMVPYAMYHNRWTELAHTDFYLDDFPLRKGAESRVRITPMQRVDWCSDETLPEYDVESLVIGDIVDLCNQYGVELVFTLMPSALVSSNQSACEIINTIAQYAQKQEIPFVNFAKEDGFLNYSLDFCDNSHLNPSGGKKLTQKMGHFLMENYDFEEKKASTIEEWRAAENRYLGTKFGELKIEAAEGDWMSYLLLLNEDDDFRFEIRMDAEDSISQAGMEQILEEVGVTKDDILFDLEENAIEVTVYRNDTGEVLHQGKFMLTFGN